MCQIYEDVLGALVKNSNPGLSYNGLHPSNNDQLYFLLLQLFCFFVFFIPQMYFRTRHFRTRHVKDQSQKPWQDYLCQEERFLLQGLGEHTAKRQ